MIIEAVRKILEGVRLFVEAMRVLVMALRVIVLYCIAWSGHGGAEDLGPGLL